LKQMLELNRYPESSKFYSEYAAGDELDHLAFVVKDVKKGTEVYVKDPDGIWIELLGSG